MLDTLPELKHVYQNHTLDSTRWNHYTPRANDIIVATPFKSGTTWMQTIVLHLIFQDLQPRGVDEFSPWLDRRWLPLDEVIGRIEAQTHRRCIKSHLPLDALPYFPQVKYIVVGRDARDVFMSLWNHYSNYTPGQYERVNTTPGRVGDPIPPCPQDIREFWQGWINRGWFAWEREGYPFWGTMYHVQTWWNYRHLPNILFVHYNDLLRDLPGEIRRVADYLSIDVAPDLLASIAHQVTFSSMKENAEQIVPGIERIFKGGAQTFINKGTNGRWRDVLTEDDLKLYAAAVARELTPDCAAWLEHGRLA
ncbi:MAG: sulfotransferase domain-containing protein [Chloroflexota bacterium]